MTTQSNAEIEVLLPREEVLRILGVASSTLNNMIREKEFPAPIKVTERSRRVGWIRSEVAQWMEQRIKTARLERDAESRGNEGKWVVRESLCPMPPEDAKALGKGIKE